MQATHEKLTPTKFKLTIKADKSELDATKAHVLKDLAKSVKVQGFRAGKVPAAMVEKNVDPNVLQSEFLDHAINDLYVAAIQEQKLRPVAQPNIAVSKFVPFTTLEFTAEIESVGEVVLADYKKIKLALTKPIVASTDIDEIVDNLRDRAASKKEVTRAAKDGDEVIIDYNGVDAKTKDPIEGTDGTDFALVLGSKASIPGFEAELVGLKPGDTKSFDIVFPKDYGAKELQSRKVKFTVSVSKVQELVKAKLDDAFAASVGPFKTVAELKADVRKQLTVEREREAQNAYDNELLDKIAEKSTAEIPDALIEEDIDRIEEDEKRNVAYQGQTWQEHLDAEGVTAEEHRAKQRPAAEKRVKAGLLLGEIAEKEGISVTPEELEIRMMILKNQYPDEGMQAELDKPEARRDINSRMMIEKTLDKLRTYGQAK